MIFFLKVWAIEPSNPGKVRVYGPGIEKGVKTNQKTYFTVDCAGAGVGMLKKLSFFLLVKNENSFFFVITSIL
jgi:hypothetical protein